MNSSSLDANPPELTVKLILLSNLNMLWNSNDVKKKLESFMDIHLSVKSVSQIN